MAGKHISEANKATIENLKGLVLDYSAYTKFIYGFNPSKNWFHSQKNLPGIYKIAIIGDSLTSNMGYFLSVAYAKTQIGLNSTGIKTLAPVSSDLFTITNSGKGIAYPSSADVNDFGILGYVCKLTGAQVITYTQGDAYPFNAFKIYYRKMLGGGVLKYKIDGGSYVTADTSHTEDDLGVLTVNIDYEGLINHTITVEIESGTCWIYGIKAYNRFYSGIQIDCVGISGIPAFSVLANNFYINKFIADTQPDQLHIWLGQNDAGSARTNSQFKSDIENIIEALTLPVQSDVVLYGFHQSGVLGHLDQQDTVRDAVMEGYKDQLTDLCKLHDYSFFDIMRVTPDRAIGNSMSFWIDTIHFSSLGYAYLANKILAFCVLPLLNNTANPSYIPRFNNDIRINKNHKIGWWRFSGSGGFIDDGTYLTGSANSMQMYVGSAEKMFHYTNFSGIRQPFTFQAYSKNSLPSAATMRDGIIVVYDEVGGRQPAYSDGTNWRRISDGAIVS